MLSAFIMIMALAWLTVSTPFVFMQQQKMMQEKTAAVNEPAAEEIPNPFANTTEEKKETGANILSEYLHEQHNHSEYTDGLLKHNKCHTAEVYVAFHGELLSPPPEI